MGTYSKISRRYSCILRTVALLQLFALLGSTLLAAFPPTLPQQLSDLQPLLGETKTAQAAGLITGKVFHDFNNNGVNDGPSAETVSEVGVAGVTVRAYDAAGMLRGTATTDSNGDYSLNANGTGPYRIELTNLPAGYEPSRHGPDNGTSTRFVNDGNTPNINFGIFNPALSPLTLKILYASYFQDGVTVGANPYLLAPANGNVIAPQPALAQFSETGSVASLAYDPHSDRLFIASAVRGEIAVGQYGAGAIYVINNVRTAPTTPALFLNLAAGGPAASTIPVRDSNWDVPEVSRSGLGGLDTNAAGTALYVWNLFDRTLYQYALDPNNLPDTPTLQATKTITDIQGDTGTSCTDGFARPWAVKSHNDQLYVGVICDASSSTDATQNANLTGAVYTIDLSSGATVAGSWSTAMAPFSMAYPHANSIGGGYDDSRYGRWRSTNTSDQPQPLITDLEFTSDDYMVLGIADRKSSTAASFVVTDGDILRACPSGGMWILEGTGGCPQQNPPAGWTNVEAPGGTIVPEWFVGDGNSGVNNTHNENSTGGLALWPGLDEVLMTAFNAWDYRPNTGGVRTLSLSTGEYKRGFNTYNHNVTSPIPNYGNGKQNLMGDIELLQDLSVLPIEIGNRVWIDLNGNGVQDPGEPGFGGITVSLQGPTTTLTTVTDSGGSYYFDNLRPDTTYTLTINTTPLVTLGYSLTQANAQAIDGPATSNDAILDTRDSDAILVGNLATIVYTTGGPGQNNHGLDFGFTSPDLPEYDLALIKTLAPGQSALVSNGSTVNYQITVRNQGRIPSGAFTVTERIPAGMSYVSATGSNFTCSESGGVVTCTYAPPISGALAPGVDATINLSLRVDDASQAPFRNWAEISADSGDDIDSTPDTNTGSDDGPGTGTPPNDDVVNHNDLNYSGNDDEDDNDYEDIFIGTSPANTGVLTITKTISGVASGPFTVTIQGPNGFITTTTVDEGSPLVLEGIAGGTYTVTEHAPGIGWTTFYSPSQVIVVGEANPAPLTPAAPISGNVFRDFNSNGVDDGANEPGVAGVTVTAYDRDGVMRGSTTTGADGSYTLNVGGYGPYRIEFTDLPEGYEPSWHGTGNGTSTQFVDSGATGVNFGVLAPCDYCQSNPMLVTNRYMNGDQSTDSAVLFSWPYTESGDITSGDGIRGDWTVLANAPEIGSVWGLTYQRTTQQLFASAFVKRHVGLGPGGAGAIYRIDLSTGTPSVSLFATIPNVGSVPPNAARGLAGETVARNDPNAWDLVGKAGLGGLELSADGNTLYVMNLGDRQLYSLNANTGGDIQELGRPNLTCTDGVARPFALKYYQEQLYTGWTCTQENRNITNDEPNLATELNNLTAHVYIYDPSTATWAATSALDIPLNYQRGSAAGGNVLFDSWMPWQADDSLLDYPDGNTENRFCDRDNPSGQGLCALPQPILGDIEFSDRGDLIVAILDRGGHQLGAQNYRMIGTTKLVDGVSFGDILIASSNGNSTFTLESNALISDLLATAGAGNVQGPSGGEFFYEDFGDGPTFHTDAIVGGMAVLHGMSEVAINHMDYYGTYRSDTAFFDTQTGGANRGVTHVNSDSVVNFTKAAGLGDLELLCDPAPIEIGNRVWHDLNNNGVQDPGEPGIAGITVSLQGPTTTVTTVTDADGNYYFGSLRPHTTYTLTINPASAELDGLNLTTPNAQAISGSPTSNDAILDTRDSDALLYNGLATILYTTGGPGQNNHGLDFGFVTPPTGEVEITNTPPVYDLALIKTLAPGQASTVTVGSVVNYEIVVRNQGNVPSGVFTVTEAIPAGMDYINAVGLGFTCDDGNVTSIVTCVYNPATGADLAPGTNATITLQLQIIDGTQRPFRNWAEISGDSGDDTDSTPDTNTGYDDGPGTGTPPNDEVDNHNDIYLDEPVDDEDDNDYEDIGVEIFDLALRKTLDVSTPGPFAPGDPVTFQIEVFNQGDLAAYNIEVSDYVPAGLILNDPNWTLLAGNRAVRTLSGPLNPGTSTTVTINFTIAPTFAGTSIRNWSEISAADDDLITNNPPPIDVDSTPDSENFNQPGETDDLTDDNVIDQNGKQGGDEDDHDPHEITVVQSYDYGDLPNDGAGPLPDYPVQNIDDGARHRIEPGVYLGARVDAETDGQPSVGADGDDLNPVLDDEDGVEFGAPLMPGTTVEITVTASVTGFLNAWFDWNGDGVLDPSERVFADEPLQPGTNVLTIAVPATATPEALYSRFRFTTGENQATLPTGAAPNGEVEDYVLLSLGNTVWFDNGAGGGTPNNGIQDGTEPGVPGVVVELLDANGNVIATTTTDADGHYLFTGLPPATYSVRIPASEFGRGEPLAGYLSSVGNGNADDPLDQDMDENGIDSLDPATTGITSTPVTLTVAGEPDAGVDGNGPNSNLTVDFGFVIMDLALRKTVAELSDTPLIPGSSTITFTIAITNQGDVTADNIVIIDYVQPGFTYDPTLNPTWTQAATSTPETTIAGPLAAGQSASVQIVLRLDAGTAGQTLYNYAEIAEYDNDNNPATPPLPDRDSTPDRNNNEDPVKDDVIDEDGKNDFGEGDEDDHDVAIIGVEIFDLALRKRLSSAPTPVIAGQSVVTFTIEVFNQGDLPAYNINVVDYVQAGFEYDPALNPTWTQAATSTPQTTIAGPLNAGQSTSVQIVLRVLASAAGQTIYNLAEIASADNDQDPSNPPPVDIDSTPDTNNDETPVKDDVIDEDGKNNPGVDDEDDHDIADLDVPGVNLGNLVWHDRDNNGQVDPGELGIDGVVVELYLATQTPGVDSPIATTVTSGGGFYNFDNLAPGQYIVHIPTPPADYPASSTPTDTNDNGEDNDDNGIQNTIGGPVSSPVITLQVGQEPDTTVDGDGTNGDLTIDFGFYAPVNLGNLVWHDRNNNGQVDPGEAGIDGVVVELYRADQIPGVDTPIATTVTSGGGFYNFDNLSPGQYVVYIPTPSAQYPISSTPTDTNDNGEDNDDNGHQDTPGGPTVSPVITLVSGDEPTNDGDGPNGDLTIDFGFIRFDLALRKTVASTSQFPLVPGTSTVNFAIAVINQGDLPANDIVVVDYLQPGWIYDQAINPMWQLSGSNLVETTIAGPLQPGQTTTVTLVLRLDSGTHGLTLHNYAEIAEYDDDNDPNTPPVPDVDSTPDRVNGENPVKDDVVDEDGKNNPGVDDEDDHDNASVSVGVMDLALRKRLTAASSPIIPGQSTATFTIEVFNQGDQTAYNIVVVDYIQPGWIYEPALNPTWTSDASKPKTTIPGPLAPGTSTTVDIVLRVGPDTAGQILYNLAEIAEMDNDTDPTTPAPVDIDSTPDDVDNETVVKDDVISEDGKGNPGVDDEDDHDIAELPVAVYDLALIKALAPSQSPQVNQGETVHYVITVKNQGTLPSGAFTVTEQIPAGMRFVSASGANMLCVADGQVLTCEYTGSLPPGESVSINLSLQVTDASQSPFRNWAEISADSGDDIDSTPDTNTGNDDGPGTGTPPNDRVNNTNDIDYSGDDDEDDNDYEDVSIVPIFDLALRKRLAPNHPPVSPGDTVSFVITVFNQGTEPAYRIQVVDTLPSGTTLLDPLWVDNGNGSASLKTPIPFLAAGASTEIFITLRVNADFSGRSLVNYAEISEADNDQDPTNTPPVDIDSTPDSDPTNDRGGEPGGPTDDVIDNTGGDEDDHDPALVSIVEGIKPVTLVSFTSRWQDGQMLIEWVTSLELETYGFRLYRSETDRLADAVLITPEVILSQGINGGSYQVLDTNVDPSKHYYYWLEEVGLLGDGKILERTSVAGSNMLYLPIISR